MEDDVHDRTRVNHDIQYRDGGGGGDDRQMLLDMNLYLVLYRTGVD